VTDPAARLDSAEGWRNVGVAFVSMFVVFGVAYSFGAFFESMSDEFGAGSGATSAVFSLTALRPATGARRWRYRDGGRAFGHGNC
jgi:hypothetical protein